jgi:hypothetical protein
MARMPNQIDAPASLREQIERCRRLAKTVADEATTQQLLALAAEYERQLKGQQQSE